MTYEYLAEIFEPAGESAEALQADPQRFANYWVQHLSPAKGDLHEETRVYRLLPSPEHLVEQVFGRNNEWIPTETIRDIEVGGPHDLPDLEPIDAATAERLIQETRGISGATDLSIELTRTKGSDT
ncbi:hypothetical protein AB0E69_13045 [Kribbella sp. NPDC026611]|uniref:hypothetical protein n=1 Tax=Kribbella sp. NPDC026611 TaxID=3154911 RepID=UPI0033E630FB